MKNVLTQFILRILRYNYLIGRRHAETGKGVGRKCLTNLNISPVNDKLLDCLMLNTQTSQQLSTSLHLAAKRQHLKVVIELVTFGARLDIRDWKRRTARDWIVRERGKYGEVDKRVAFRTAVGGEGRAKKPTPEALERAKVVR